MEKIVYIIVCLTIIFGCKNKEETQKAVAVDEDKFSQLTSLIDHFAEENLSKGNVNSFAVAVYRDGKMYQNYYGTIKGNQTNKPNDTSLYEIASITKTFTGSLVAKAVLAGKLNLDDDIRKYLDGDYTNLEFKGKPITIKHLLTHSLGFKIKTPPKLEAFNQRMNSGENIDTIKPYTIQDLLEELKTIELNKKPGTHYAYTSVGPELLAYILEKVNNKPFKEQLTIFLDDIGMHNTYLNESEKHLNILVRGYDGKKLAPVDYCPIYGAAGGAISTLSDLSIYMKYLVDNKELPWVKEASRQLFEDTEEDETVGYLWQNIGFAKEEGYYYSKTGTSNGIQSVVLICPDSNYGMVVLVNNTSDEAFNDWVNLTYRDIEPLLIKYPKLNLTSIFRKDFSDSPSIAFQNFRELKNDTINYSFSIRELNNFGYDLLNEKQNEKAIKVFQFLTKEFPENANLYDSLGEAFFISEEYENALQNFKKALQINPDMKSSKDYIKKIEEKKSK